MTKSIFHKTNMFNIFYQAVKSSKNGIIVTNNEGIINFVNNSAMEILGYKINSEILNMSFFEVIPEEITMDEFDEYYETEIFCTTKNNENVKVEITVSEIRDNEKIIGKFISLSDITKREVLRKKLKQKKKELNELSEKNDNDFIRFDSKDIISPVTILNSYAEFLLNMSSNNLNSIQKEMISKIIRKSKYIKELSESFVEIKQLDEQNIKLEYGIVNYVVLLKTIISQNQILALRKNIKVELDINTDIPQLYLDEERIEEALIHVLSSAVEYSKNDSIVHVNLSIKWNYVITKIECCPDSLQEKDRRALGIKENSNIAKLNSSQEHNIGLVITNNIVKSHNGRMGIRLKNDNLLTIYLILPINI